LNAQGKERQKSEFLCLGLLIVAALLVRLSFLANDAFSGDIDAYARWAMTLSTQRLASFDSSMAFPGYPAGYFYIFALVGHVWRALTGSHDQSLAHLRVLVKLPSILGDLGVGALIYAIVRRFAGARAGLIAAVLYLFNPAIIYLSAFWGQVDSISGGLAALAIYALLRSEDVAPRTRYNFAWVTVAWLFLTCSLLINPQAIVLSPLIFAFALVDPHRRRERVIATTAGIAGALGLALIVAEPLHPSPPPEALSWLLHGLTTGYSLYPYTPVNAFNLWALHGNFWTPDSRYVLGLPEDLWGVVLVSVATTLIVWRYVNKGTSAALVESCAIVALASFVLATRIHERCLFDGLLFTIACVPLARRYLWGAVAFSIALFANIQYSMQYLYAIYHSTSGLNYQNLWGLWTTLYSLLAILTFTSLAYQFLSGADGNAGEASSIPPHSQGGASWKSTLPSFRKWFDPLEGLRGMRAPWDYAFLGILGVGSFVLSFVSYWWPPGKVFDEIYFARAGEEYLQNRFIYESTHPPLTKLLITGSMMLFGGMPRGDGLGGWPGLNTILGHMSNGDNSYGWRFLSVVSGALVVMLLYVFTKRVTGSTCFATLAALFLTCDGMHFVQSRVATPEGFVVFFATLALYAFYRFWICSQVGNRPYSAVPAWGFASGAGASLLAGLAVATLGREFWRLDTASTVVVTLYLSSGIYLIVRYVCIDRIFGRRKRELSYGEGSYALRRPSGTALFAADGGIIASDGTILCGSHSRELNGTLTYAEKPLRIDYSADAKVTYRTPDGTVTYANNRIYHHAKPSVEGSAARGWLVLACVALGLLMSSKWYGVMDVWVCFVVLIAVWLQRRSIPRRPTLWGNPRSYRLDGALVGILFVTATIYLLAWTPDLARHSPDPFEVHNVNELIFRQYSMFEYHHNLLATHPYSSKWWEWPLDYVPMAYFYYDSRANKGDPRGCCIYEITSLPNPFVLWFGLISVPIVGVLAVLWRNKAYALIILAYLLQWIPWARSPRITFAYHFYDNIPLICLCNAIVLQRVWKLAQSRGSHREQLLIAFAIATYAFIVAVSFIYFYPVLSAHPLSWNAWHQRMWINKWIVGPG
jgi:dolichyl-phosphate-mannose--protein O-mannosyl transferase